MFATRALAPLIGYGIGAWATSMYVDLSGAWDVEVGGCNELVVCLSASMLTLSCVSVSFVCTSPVPRSFLPQTWTSRRGTRAGWAPGGSGSRSSRRSWPSGRFRCCCSRPDSPDKLPGSRRATSRKWPRVSRSEIFCDSVSPGFGQGDPPLGAQGWSLELSLGPRHPCGKTMSSVFSVDVGI